jgi:hypothetical protein
MGSEKIMELIQRDLDDDLSPAEKEALEAHLSQRPEDAKFAKQLRLLSKELSRLPKVNPPSSVIDSILPVIEEDLKQTATDRERIRFRWIKTGVAIAIVAAIVLFSLPFVPVEQGSQMSTSLHEDSDPAKKMGETSSDSQNDMTMSTFESQDAVWSPNQIYQAKWEEERLVVRKRSGEIQYQSERYKGERLIRLEWKSNREIEVIISGKDGQETVKKVTIDVEQKKRTK